MSKAKELNEKLNENRWNSRTLRHMHENLEEIRDEMLMQMEAAENIIRHLEGEPGGRMVAKRAQSYWLPQIVGTIEGRASMVSMQETLDEIRTLDEEGEVR